MIGRLLPCCPSGNGCDVGLFFFLGRASIRDQAGFEGVSGGRCSACGPMGATLLPAAVSHVAARRSPFVIARPKNAAGRVLCTRPVDQINGPGQSRTDDLTLIRGAL